MLDRDKVLEVFRQALEDLRAEVRARGIRPRTVGLRAHQVYCANLNPGEKRPSSETFRKYVSGKTALPEIIELLEEANVRPTGRARLDRKRVRAVFQEAVRRLEARILRGQAKPLQIARRAHELYNRGATRETLRPSHYTFRRLIYGKAADPEILTLIEEALKRKD
jgi:hypothetical protein